MSEILWFGGLLFASLWGSNNLPAISNAQPGAVTNSVLGTGDGALNNPPSLQEILRAMPKVPSGIPYIYEESRDNLEFTVEKTADRLDPPCYFPFIGSAQWHRCRWKCTVYFTENIEVSQPFPFREKTRRAEVVYVDKDRLHLCGNQSCDVAAQQPEAPANCPGGHFSGKQIVRHAGGTEASQEPPPSEPRVTALPMARKVSVPPSAMTLAEVVQLSKHAGIEDIIVRHIELTGCVFHLTTQDLLYLLEQGVSPRVIRVMQESAAGALSTKR